MPEASSNQKPPSLDVEAVVRSIEALVGHLHDVQRAVCQDDGSSSAQESKEPELKGGGAAARRCGCLNVSSTSVTGSVTCCFGRGASPPEKAVADPAAGATATTTGAVPAVESREVKIGGDGEARAAVDEIGVANGGGNHAAGNSTSGRDASSLEKAVATPGVGNGETRAGEETEGKAKGAATLSEKAAVPAAEDREVKAGRDGEAKAVGNEIGIANGGGNRAAGTSSLGQEASSHKKAITNGEIKAGEETKGKSKGGQNGTASGGGNRHAAVVPGIELKPSKEITRKAAGNHRGDRAAAAGSPKRPASPDKEGVSTHQANGTAVDGRGDVPKGSIDSSKKRLKGDNLKVYNEAEKLLRDLNNINTELSKLKNLGSDFEGLQARAEQLQQVLISRSNTAILPTTQAFHGPLLLLADKVKAVKNQMPGHSAPATNTEGGQNVVKDTEFKDYQMLSIDSTAEIMDRIQDIPCFKELLADYAEAFKSLRLRSKLCLCCFSIFPEGAVVHKKLLVYWWIGEGFVDPHLPGNNADDVLKELCSKGFIEPVLKKQKLFGFEMDPLVRFVVITMAEKLGFFHFDSKGLPTAEFSYTHRACLVKNQAGHFSRKLLTSEKESSDKDMDRLHTLFNVNDPYPDFKLEWFVKLKSLNVLYLGGWEGSKGHHIEVEGTEYLRALRNMKYLKFLSLQGISRITDLPDSLCALTNLKILDLNACHHLESLPKKLGELKNLTHLDISECYLLDHIPKGLGQLTGLEVLKGFVIGGSGDSKDSCTLDDLKGLKNLKKLSITSSRDDFPSEDEVTVLQGFQHLKKLMIAWGGKSSKAGDSIEKGAKGIAAKPDEVKGKAAEAKKGDKDKSTEQVKGDEGTINGQKQEKGISTEQQQDIGVSAEQKKADKGKGASGSRVSFVEPQAPAETTAPDSNRSFAGQEKGVKGERADQEGASPKSPKTVQPAQPAQLKKLTSMTSKKLVRGLTFRSSASSAATPGAESSQLEKLELQCCPLSEAPVWMVKGKLKPTEKLYIRGGDLCSLKHGHGSDVTWTVKILCLKYLADLEMNWRELQELFPGLVYLEKSCSPKLSFFPCNSSGVWIKKKPELLEEVRKDLSWSFLA